jgi:molybdenum-pterin binding domain
MPAREPLLAPREAAIALGISYPTIKQWTYSRKIKSVKTAGGHHRIPESELDRFVPRAEAGAVRDSLRRVSGRNQLVGRIVEIRKSGLLAQVRLSIGGQQITAIITADAANAMRLKKGEHVAALVKSTEVMILRV